MGTGAVESVGGLLSSTLVQGAGVLSQVLCIIIHSCTRSGFTVPGIVNYHPLLY